jgi:hypothetical protein
MISGVPGFPIRYILLENISLDSAGGAPDEAKAIVVPEGEKGYPDAGWFGVKHFPAYGFYIRHAEDVFFKGVNVVPKTQDTREFASFGPGVWRFKS